jgi:8-oxo-dGTP diphosphatase
MSKQTARAIIFHHDGRLLMVERYRHSEHYFVLPGGHMDAGETPEKTVMREVYEETGLRVRVIKLLYTSVDVFGNDQKIYLCEYNGRGEPALQPQSIEARVASSDDPRRWLPGWFSFDELRTQTVYPRDLLRYVEEDRASGYHHNSVQNY